MTVPPPGWGETLGYSAPWKKRDILAPGNLKP